MAMCGGIGAETIAANEEVQGLVDQLKAEINAKCNKTFSTLTAISYKTQVVAGTNYFVKIKADEEHIHARIYHVPWQNSLELTAVAGGKTADDTIEFFD
eukprot:JP448762.1.p2 GENE.JP448762.1~~JP448762.1.p2  ORF type:complete len:99 (+),score=35.24 JP448762.1:35-331(+)